MIHVDFPFPFINNLILKKHTLKAMLSFVLCVALASSVKASTCQRGQQCSSCIAGSGDCQDECYVGYYGKRCNNPCSPACKGQECRISERGTGVCTKGCYPGYYGSTCRAPCREIQGCYRCSRECEEGYCHGDGECFADCENSFYGENCTSCSPSCKQCNRETGLCEMCIQGYGGADCTRHCNNCIGQCLRGCTGGCKPGYYGTFCEKACSAGCKSDCDVQTGHCPSCKPGWYGTNCTLRCNLECLDQLCDYDDGKCSNGCLLGYFGERCSLSCNNRCIGNNCVEELCSQCIKDETVARDCYQFCNDMCPSNCSRNGCVDYNRLVSPTDTTTVTQKDQQHHSGTTHHIAVTIPTLVATVVSLVVVVIVIMIYFSCYFKRIRGMIYGNVQLRRGNSVHSSGSEIPSVVVHDYAEVDINAIDERNIELPMPVIADMFGEVTSDDDDKRCPKGETTQTSNRNSLHEPTCFGSQSAYIHPVHDNSL